jgi:hypothetical protein
MIMGEGREDGGGRVAIVGTAHDRSQIDGMVGGEWREGWRRLACRNRGRPGERVPFLNVRNPQPKAKGISMIVKILNSFMAKAIGLVVNCDDMVGKQFEKGLADLNLVAQRGH